MPSRKCAECGEVHLAGPNGAIYCGGTLLRAVQMSNMFRDSKHFVDMSSRYSPDRILADWQLFSSCKRNENSVKHLTNFVDNHFDPPGAELEYWCPPDWRSEPAFLSQVKDPKLRKFAIELNGIWKELGRHIKDSVRSNPFMYTMVYTPGPMIVPGGRFSEFYYWDTYWIVRGLLFSGMYQTARGIIDNLLFLVQEYKFVPNGGRIYYWGRSQPPLLVPMVKCYVEITKDDAYAQKALPMLEMEMDNFLKNHAVQVQGRTLYQYRDRSSGPRPEAYREDVQSASSYGTEEEKEEYYSNIKAACESGMNFSSRWFVSPKGDNVGTMEYIKTTWIVPVDLNCILFRNCKTLAEFNTLAGNKVRADHYRHIACSLIKAITAILWNKERGVWFDYDLHNRKPRDYFVVTNLSPLWARAYPINDTKQISESVMRYIEENKLDSFPGGVPHTLNNTGQQWDYPNVWPPMMHILIEGLNNLGTPEAKEMSQRWRERWVRSNYDGFTRSGFMFEKYNCEESGSAGGGGEYITQTGYGWTNGVMLELVARYGQELTSSDAAPAGASHCGVETCQLAQNESFDEEDIITSDAYLAEQKQESVCSCDKTRTPAVSSDTQIYGQKSYMHDEDCACNKPEKPQPAESLFYQSTQSEQHDMCRSEVCCHNTVYKELSTPTVVTSETSRQQETQTNFAKCGKSAQSVKAPQCPSSVEPEHCAKSTQSVQPAPCLTSASNAQAASRSQAAPCGPSAQPEQCGKSAHSVKPAKCASGVPSAHPAQCADDVKSADLEPTCSECCNICKPKLFPLLSAEMCATKAPKKSEPKADPKTDSKAGTCAVAPSKHDKDELRCHCESDEEDIAKPGKSKNAGESCPKTSNSCNGSPHTSMLMMKLFPLGDDKDPVKKPPIPEETGNVCCDCKKSEESKSESKKPKENEECS